MIDLDKLELLNKARTAGEWECDGDQTEGGWGRYQAYVIRTDKGRIADCVNADYQVSEIHEEGDEDGVHRWDEIGRRNFEFIAAAANSTAVLIEHSRNRADLAMLVKRIIYRHGKGLPLDDVLAKATDYLTRKDLNGSPLRETEDA